MAPCRERERAGDAGFTIIEALVAIGIALALLSAVFAAVNVQFRLGRAHPGSIDIAERARALFSVVQGDLVLAGAGFALEDGQSGLGCCLPAINPRRLGFSGADPPGTARDDVLTVIYVPGGAPRSRLAGPVAGVSPLVVMPGPPCPSAPFCGLADRDDAVVFDGQENHDYFRVHVAGGSGTLLPRQAGPGITYSAGSYLARVETHTYYFDSAASQVRHYDGYLSDVPVIDNVVAFRAEYYGENRPPSRPKPPSGTANCLYDSAGAARPWPSAIGGSADLVAIPLAALRDGPWCGAGDNRFDADLLRIRRVRLLITLQAADALRAAGALFTRAGQGNAALSLVPDLSVAIDVTPRSLNAGR